MTSAVITLCVALTGYFATYLNGLRLSQRERSLERLNRQLAELYGPLLALVEANHGAYRMFSRLHPRDDGRNLFQHHPDRPGDQPPTDEELAEWRTWTEAIILPNQRAMRQILTTKADLLVEPEMPGLLMELYVFSAIDEIELPRWVTGTRTQLPQEYPAGAATRYVRARFDELKRKQTRLLGSRG
ncbi:hypothetical protein [Streptomyces reniochalinae]|uniref:Uncharacterized protein n=1 Tax=Streptomyces reniochalinae TaxID=2250578 RepID=A0A367EHC6_9ACTN|nr:hypothetical protein [Streptomyces reniochalinae]RCG17498.1 hypothetical protein DQ392_16630 [Streptomyces reniochalinae]